MSKENKKDFSDVDYRFSFSLTINDSEINDDDIIICKRDFNIFNLDEESLCSLELKECIDDVTDMINRDLKSKSRAYIWYNMSWDLSKDENGCRNLGVFHGNTSQAKDISSEFTDPIPEKSQTTFKFTLFDKGRAIITKIWSGDAYPFSVRNSVDLTNRKYKHDNSKFIELDFVKQIAQKASADRSDLTSVIMRHISSTCASYPSKQSNKKLMYKQNIPELKLEDMVINEEKYPCGYTFTKSKQEPIRSVTDDNGFEKLVYEVYTTKFQVGKSVDKNGKATYSKEYNLSTKKSFR